MARSLNVATPAATVRVRVPESRAEPPLGSAPPGLIATLISVVLYPIKGLPIASGTATLTEGVIVVPAVVFDGWPVEARWVAALVRSLNVRVVASFPPRRSSDLRL